MPLPEDTSVLRSDFRLRNVSLKRCTKVRHEYEAIQSSEVYGGKTPTSEGLADASQPCLPLLRPYSSKRNALLQDRPGSGPGKENMNPEDGTELCSKNVISCDRPSKGSSMGSSKRITCESRSSVAMAPGSQVRPQQGALTSTIIDRCRRRAVASLTQLPNQQNPRPSKGTGQTQIRYGPEQGKDEMILWSRAEARQKKKQPCIKVASQSTSGSPAPITKTTLPPLNVLYYSLGLVSSRPRVTVGSCLDILESLTVDITKGVLDHNRLGRVCAEHCMLRKSLHILYQNQSCILLYQRHKDSLKHAALCIPLEPTPRASLVKTIIRSQCLFINLWTKSYDRFILQAPLEDESSFARNSDIAFKGRTCVTIFSFESARSWQQIVLESLMLIHLLAIAEAHGIFLRNLLIDSSCLKSKHVISKELPKLLLPFFGNYYRLLARLRYLASKLHTSRPERVPLSHQKHHN